MQVFSMSDEIDDSHRSEYVLVKLQSTPLVSYHDAQDTKYTDDFDVTLIVTWLEQFAQLDNREITLKYYLMLTSRRELYPKREVENSNKIGKFRTVYTVVKSMTNSQVDTPSESSPVSAASPYTSKHIKSELMSNSSDFQTEVGTLRWVKSRFFSLLFSICPSYCYTLNFVFTTKQKLLQSCFIFRTYIMYSNFTLLYLQDMNNTESLGSLRECEGLDSEKQEEEITSPQAPTPPPVPDSPLAPHVVSSSNSTSTANLTQIRQESVNYLGYYSSHEQLMQQLIMSQAAAAQQHIRNMVEQGALHCRTHLLWNRLLESRSLMTYAEFMELRSLASVEPLSQLDPRLSPLLNQPIGWYQSLAKVLQNKYQEYHKQFNAPDGNVTHHLILHPNYVQAFMMLTIDLHTSRGVSRRKNVPIILNWKAY